MHLEQVAHVFAKNGKIKRPVLTVKPDKDIVLFLMSFFCRGLNGVVRIDKVVYS